jgi:hypothetical protein
MHAKKPQPVEDAMRRFVTVVLIGLLGLVTPAFAQSPNAKTGAPTGKPDVFNTQGTQGTNPDVTPDDGTGAFAQVPPPGGFFGNTSPFLVIGGIVGGAGLIGFAVSQSQSSSNPTSP